MEALGLDAPPLFNSGLEAGLRALILLEALHPRPCGLRELTWFDHVVVHTGDLNGPRSLHPDLPGHTGELIVRRRLVENGLHLMMRLHLVEAVHDEAGLLFSPSEDAASFVDLLQSPYNEALRERAEWIASQFGQLPPAKIEEMIAAKVGRWTATFAWSVGTEDSR
jgi:hypothetical protein